MDTSYVPVSPALAFGLGIALMVSVTIICIYRGVKTKNNIFYADSELFCFMSFAGLAGALCNIFCSLLC